MAETSVSQTTSDSTENGTGPVNPVTAGDGGKNADANINGDAVQMAGSDSITSDGDVSGDQNHVQSSQGTEDTASGRAKLVSDPCPTCNALWCPSCEANLRPGNAFGRGQPPPPPNGYMPPPPVFDGGYIPPLPPPPPSFNGRAQIDGVTKQPGAAQKPHGPFLTYRNVYRNAGDRNEVLFTSETYKAAKPTDASDHEHTTNETESQDRIAMAEVIIQYKAARPYPPYSALMSAPPVARLPTTSLMIRSPRLIEAVRSAVKDYPEANLMQNEIHLEEPFRIVARHHDQLVEHRDKLKPAAGQEDDSIDDTEYLEMKLLIDFLDERVMDKVRAEKERHKNGKATWEMLWLLFKPGEDVSVVINWAGTSSKNGTINRIGAIIESVLPPFTWKPKDTLDQYGLRSEEYSATVGWRLNLWSLGFDGVSLRRRRILWDILSFDGEAEISGMIVVPMDHAHRLHLNLPNEMPLQDYLIEQGKKYYGLFSPRCMHHSGEVLEFPFHKLDDLVMIDLITYFEQRIRSIGFPMSECSCKPGIICQQCMKSDSSRFDNDTKYGDYDNLHPDNVKTLSNHKYFLCPQAIPAYAFRTREWEIIDVSSLTPARFDPKTIDKLVMKDKRLELLKKLSKNFMGESEIGKPAQSRPWMADFVVGKGNSLIFLLHGPPGVGKTYTAECIAEFLERPLMTLTLSDIGIDSYDLEKNLTKNFKIAKKWGAVLLIDEADIYLERRAQSDLTRNSLVAGFLRVLEIYDGLLFLTTNRVGAFDDAFISRVHVQLHYPTLEDADREKIWRNFIKKLETDRGDKMRMKRSAKDYLLEGKQIQKLELNGREIRNIFQTAVGLAEFDSEKDEDGVVMLKEEHLSQVADMSGEFKHYLTKLHTKDESGRAAYSKLRLDDIDRERY